LAKSITIKRGTTRTVFLTRRYAIKVPRLKHCNGYKAWNFVRGWAANISERDWSAYEDARNEITPVIKSWLGGLINVYPRAEPFVGDYYDAHDAWETLTFKTPSDVKPWNFGYLNGKLVWLDYDMNWNDCKRCGNEHTRN
jgi:hypothetical protein